MTEFFYSFIRSVNSVLGAGGIFLIACALIIFAFFLAIWVQKEFKKRLFSFLICAFSVLTAEYGFEKISGELGFLPFAVSLSALLTFVLILTAKNSKKSTKEQRELARFLDGAVLNSNNILPPVLPPQETRKTLSQMVCTPQSEKLESKPCDLDFSHVKSVLKRMQYYPLTPADKRQVSDLDSAIIGAESIGLNDDAKNRINDGLGALLKIMSKYGI